MKQVLFRGNFGKWRSINVVVFKVATRRATLYALCLMMVFTLIMPAETRAWSLFGDGKPQPRVLDAQPVDTTRDQATGSSSATASENTKPSPDRTRVREDESKRTANSSTYVNRDGTKTLEYSLDQQNFRDGSSWKKIDNTLRAVEKQAPEPSWWQSLTNTEPEADPPSEYRGKAGTIDAIMKPLSTGVQFSANGKTFTMKPSGARDVKPERKDDHTVIYRDAYPDVDLEYELRGESIKEIIVIKNKSAQTEFDFVVDGGKVIAHPQRAGELTIEGMPAEFSFSSLTLDVNERGVISEQRVTQTPSDKGIRVVMDKSWMQSQSDNAFPMRIDPSFVKQTEISYQMFKSDGYSCNASNCYANTGTIDDGTGYWKHWRTYVHFPYTELAGKKVTEAKLYGWYKTDMNGTTSTHNIYVGHASCVSYNCQGNIVGSAAVSTDFNIDFTSEMNSVVKNGDYGAWWSVSGEEIGLKTFKPYRDMKATITYDTPTPSPTPVEPADKQVTVNTQPTLRVNPVTDPDGDTVQYQFSVSTNADGTGAVVNSEWSSSTQFVVPDGILQDGTTYYWRTNVKGATQTESAWRREFKLDLRTGKDSTQAYDTVGPVGVDLATGNGTTSTGTHSMSALGGSIGLNLDYNSPTKSKTGLTGEYWNVNSGYSFASGAPTSTPILTRNDQDINFDWNSGNPVNPITSDWFYARWKGHFVAPVAGTYQFGAANDDAAKITVNNQDMGGGCYGSTPCYNGTSVTLAAGQVVPINVEYQENTGDANMKLYVKGAVAEQVVSRDWLRTEVVASQVQYGLTGRYYTDDGTHNLTAATSDPARLMMARQDTKISFDWGSGSLASGLRADNFMTRWTGYITVPTTGSYTFGATVDDGIRIKLNNGLFGASQTVLDSWQDQATTLWGTQTNLTAGQQVPITVEYYEKGGGASINLKVRGPNIPDQEIPVKWLTPKASALPSAWQLGVDVDGNVGYERLRVVGSNVILEDSTRGTHEYTGTGTGFKPPVNEDGQLTRNANNTYTLLDMDGRTYVFDAEGKLTSVTSPTDDRNPASLKYEYSGDPSRLVKITDGVNNARYGTLHYKSVNEDANCSVPSGFDAAPDGMLCAFKTSDGDITKLYYKSGQLSRVEKPGGEITDYGYDAMGRIVSMRDSMANDAITASVRTDNDELLTQVTYDQLGRISGVQAPAPTSGAARNNHTFEYLPSATQLHIAGTTEPHGFSKRVEYDSLFRTIREIDVANLSTTQEWDAVKDLQLATTDATGLKSTTIYNDDDRPTESYGAAPASWYGADRKPLAAYTNQVPKTTTGYDEGMTGLAVTYSGSNAPSHAYILNNGQIIYRGQGLVSLDRRFQFNYQTDGNIVLYGPSGAMWSSNTAGQNSTSLTMQSDGNMVLYNGGSPVWYTGTNGGPTSRLVIQNDGNAVIYTATNATWSTSTSGWGPAGSANISLTGGPLQHATNIATDGTISKSYGTTAPINGHSGAWGMSLSGKMRLPTTGNWTFRIASDNGVRVWIDDMVVQDDWVSGEYRSHPTFTYNNTVAGSSHRFRIDYYHALTGSAAFNLYATAPGGSETANVAQYFSPNYGLKTSQTAYDAQLGNTTTTTSYAKPEYGLATTTTLDPSGMNLQATATFESPGSGFLRQTGRTLPGGTSQTYSYYGANDSVDNPCTAENDPAIQAGATKGKVETDPDGSGPKQPRTTETVYNNSGRVVATKFNNDPWTCVTYDSRGRQTQSIQPAINGRLGRTINTQHAADGNPLKKRVIDSVAGTVESTIDLLGRTVSSKDVWGNDYVSTYDNYGNITQKTSPLGTETYTYDTFFRLTNYALDSMTLATMTYDSFGRMATVTYPEAKDAANNTLKLTQVKRDTIGRNAGVTYQTSDGKIFDENVVKSQVGKITSATQSYDAQNINSTFTYDVAGRLTSGTVGQTKFDYGYNSPDSAACGANSANNALAHKNSNRTSYKVTNTATSTVVVDDKSCYNYADQLTYSTDANIGTPVYDDHGNTTSFSGNGTPLVFGYNANDHNISVTQGTKRTEYLKTVTGDVLRKKEFNANQLTSSYRYVAGGAVLQTCSLTDDNNCTTVDRYLTLPGNVSLTLSPTNQDTSKRVVYSLHNYHGDTALTLTTEGKTTASTNTLLAYGAFGEQLIAGTLGTTTASAINATDSTMGWAADPTRKQEGGYTTSFIQMGARVYIPTLGRFLQMDPVDGGTLNGYVYVADPINSSDYNGKWGFGDFIASVVAVVRAVVKAVATPVVTVVKAMARVVSATSAPAKPASTKSATAGKAASSGRYIERVKWDGNTLQVYPTPVARIIASQQFLRPPYLDPFRREAAWQEVIKMAPEANSDSMRDQFMCHWDIVSIRAPRKESWNLDSERPDVGYLQTVLNRCNPQ